MFFAKGQGSGWMTEPDGTFVIRRLPPGEYAFHATSETFPTNEEREESEPITLQVDSDVDGLTLPMRRAVKVAGRVVVEGDPPLVHPASIQILATPPREHMMVGPNIISVREDGTFSARLVHKTLLRLNDVGGKWFLKAVRYKGADVTDVPTEFGESSDASQLELVLTNRGGRIAGRVVDPDGSPVVAGLVLVFAQDQRVWFPAASTTQAQGIEQNGRFEISGLRPESYYIMAVPSAEEALPVLMTDPRKLFEKLAPLATRVEITGDERREVTLTVNK
jgi:hypothetical protein